MNIKVQFNKKVHKLPKESSKDLQSLLKGLHIIFKEKLPKQFSILYESIQQITGLSGMKNGENYQNFIKNDKEFLLALANANKNSKTNSLKIYILKKKEDNDDLLSQSQISVSEGVLMSQQQLDDDDMLMMTSTIKREAEKEDVQNKESKKKVQQEEEKQEENLTKIEQSQEEQKQQQISSTPDQEVEKQKEGFKYEGSIFDEGGGSQIFQKNKQIDIQNAQKQEPEQEENQYIQQQIIEKQIQEEEENIYRLYQKAPQQKETQKPIQQQEKNLENNFSIKNEQKQQQQFQCYDCEQGNLNQNCSKCRGTGQIAQNDGLVRLIEQIMDYKLAKLMNNNTELQKIILNNNNKNFGIQDINNNNNDNEKIICEVCFQQIMVGARYQCSECPSYNLCQNCEPKSKHPHDFLKIRFQKNDSEKNNNIVDQIKGFGKQVIDNMKDIIPKTQNNPEPQPEQQQKQQSVIVNESKINNQSTIMKQYKAKFVDSPQGQVKTQPGAPYQWSVILKNNGDQNWPKNVRFHCVQGVYYGISEKVKAISPGESFQIDLNLNSIASGKQAVCWRLGYTKENENGQDEGVQHFGPKVTYELIVEGGNLKSQIQNNNNNMDANNPVVQCSQANNSDIMSQNKVVLEKAQQLSMVFGEDVKLFVQFIQNRNLQEASLDTLSNMYLADQDQKN